MHVGDGLDRMVEAVAAALAAVTQDLAVLHPGEGMLDAGTDPTVLGVVFLLTREEWPAGPFWVRGDQACVDKAPSPSTVTPSQCWARPEFRQTWASARLPGPGKRRARPAWCQH